MKFIVCIKHVPDATSLLRIEDGRIDTSAGRMALNAFDASAAEGAIAFTERYGGEVHAALAGPPEAREALRKALAMGAAAGVHLQVREGDAPPVGQACAQILANHLRTETFDAILCGKQAQDTDAGVTPAMLAELLGLPFVGNAIALAPDPDGPRANRLLVTRQADAHQEITRVQTPCVISCSNNMCDPRIPNIRGVMAARKKPIQAKTVETPAGLPAMSVQRYEPMPGRPPVRMLDETWDEALDVLVPFVRRSSPAT